MFEDTANGKTVVVEYELDSALGDIEQIPLQEDRAIDAFPKRKIQPLTPDAWYRTGTVEIGYEISFNRYFYKPQPMRILAEAAPACVRAPKQHTDGLSAETLGSAT